MLLAAKLRALVAGGWEPGAGPAVESPFPGGATLRRGSRGWVLGEDEPARLLGPAVAWAEGHGVADLHLVVPAEAGRLARRAALFTRPPSVWSVKGAAVVRADPAPASAEAPLPPEVARFAPVLEAAGADVVVEGGVLRGEVLGLEVARVVVDGPGAARLEVGIGRHDREAQRALHGDDPPPSLLAGAVAVVRARRRPGEPSHPLNQLARERWLRSVLVGRPELVGASSLTPAPAASSRDDLRRHSAAPATGVDLDGRPLVVACSVGIDLDLVPAAADARLTDGRRARLLLALPERDAHPVTRSLATLLAEPAEVVTVPDGWEGMAL